MTRRGRGRARGTIAFIPGLGTTAALWSAVAESLDSDLEIVIAELPGHGRQAAADAFTIPDLAALGLRELDGSAGPTILVGHSMGGAVAAEMVKYAPHRFFGLVLVCSSDRFGDDAGWVALISRVRGEGLTRIADEAPEGWFTPDFREDCAAVVQQHVESFISTHLASYLACCTALARYDGRATLSDVAVPTVLIGASDDTGTPAESMRRMTAEIDGAGFIEIAGAHLAPVQSPLPIAAAIASLLPPRLCPTADGKEIT